MRRIILIFCFSLAFFSTTVESKKPPGFVELTLHRRENTMQSLLKLAHTFLINNGSQIQSQDELFQRMREDLKIPTVKNDSIALYKHFDSDFYTILRIGKPGNVEYKMLVDTSWRDTWVFSDKCTSWVCVNKEKYNFTHSKTAHPDGREFVLNLGNGDFGGMLKGNFVIDTILFAHTNATNVTFVEISDVPWYFFFLSMDGILGLSRGSNTAGTETPLTILARQNGIKKRLFCFYVNRDPTTEHAGSILIGTPDPHHFDATTAAAVRVLTDNEWRFTVRDIIFTYSAKKKPEDLLHFCGANDIACTAVLDSGSNSISGPKTAIKNILKLIKAETFFLGFYRVACEKMEKLPKLTFKFGSKRVILKGEDYVQQIYYRGYLLCLASFVPNADDNPSWSFGISFFNRYYTMFDMDKKIITICDYKTSNKTVEEKKKYF